MPRLLYITTDPIALNVLLEGQLAYFRDMGYEVIAVAAPGADLDAVAQRDAIQIAAVPMQREISPLADLASLWRMWRLMRRLRPDIVCTATAKASLIGLLAAWFARVPVRVYRLWGLRLETATGLKRRVLWLAEWISAACAHRVLCISESLRIAFIQGGLANSKKVFLVGNGSNNGIRRNYFLRTPEICQAAAELRRQWGIPERAPVVGFVGRFVRDKGIVELVNAFEQILSERPDAWLLLVGGYETGDPVPEAYVRRIGEHPRIVAPGFVQLKDLAPYYAAMSVFAFPTFREGFGNVAVEAALAELPVVTFNATGAVDTVVEGVTGAIVELGNSKALAKALSLYLNDSQLAAQHGAAGRARAETDFRPEPIWRAMDDHFRELLRENGKSNTIAHLKSIAVDARSD